jgi:hypothetical protein
MLMLIFNIQLQCLLLLLLQMNNNTCLPCRRRRQSCGPNCPTRGFLEDEHRYNRVVEVFTYENARRWLVHARESNQTGDCCTTLIWEADRRLNNVVGGSYAAYQQLVQQNTQQTGVIEGLNNEIQLLNTQVNTLTDENVLLRGDLGFVCELSFGGEGMRELIFLF